MCLQRPKKLFTRSEFLRVSAGTVAAAAWSLSSSVVAAQPETSSSPAPGSDGGADIDPLLSELDDKVKAGMQEYGIPGVALGLLHQGIGYIRGYGVTNVDDPQQVDGNTLFRIGSTTKTFTGTAVMRLADQGKLNLDATVQTYLPDFATSDPSGDPATAVEPQPGMAGRVLRGHGVGRRCPGQVRGGDGAAPAADAIG